MERNFEVKSSQGNVMVPEGLEERLSEVIDHWELQEKRVRRFRRNTVVSLCIMLGIGTIVWAGYRISAKGTPQETGVLTKSETSIPKNSELLFDNAEIQDIAATLSKRYHVRVTFRNEKVRHLRFYVHFERSMTLQQAVQHLNNFQSIKLTLNDGELIIE